MLQLTTKDFCEKNLLVIFRRIIFEIAIFMSPVVGIGGKTTSHVQQFQALRY
jgi:hypothetical protein